MKKLIILFLLLFSLKAFSQLDLEHWFPPVYRSQTFSGNSSLEINISTPHVIPFKVYVYTRGGLKHTFTISKNNPAKYSFIGSEYIGAGVNVMKIRDTGIHLVGENSFFADLRFYQGGNSEMIFSKGKSALGTSFLSVNTNIDMYEGVGGKSFMTSVMATRDNTKIKFYNYDKKIKFIDGSTGGPKEITLNKGESYVFVALKSDNFNIYDNEYFNSWNGAKIESDKPITVISGGFNTQYAFENGPGSTLLEQIVPIKQLGKEFFMKRAFSNISKHTEKAFIVSTKNNTKLYFNSSLSPTVTLDAGDYYLTPISLFSGDNMYIKSSEPIYCMQLSAGTNKADRGGDYSYESGSMSYLHPFDKKLPGTIDKIMILDKIGNTSYRNFLNILIPKENSLQINNQAIESQYGPFSINGNDEYVYYSLKDFLGDAEIKSENGLIAEIIGGNTEFYHGWSSATTGFSNDPKILINGNCIEEDVELKVSNIDFEGFQWQLNGRNIPSANSPIFHPILSGNYRCVLSYSGLTYITPEVFIDHCPYFVNEKFLGNICSEISGIAKFSPPNTNLSIDKFRILTQPTNGNIVISNVNMSYIYKANNNYSGPDRFIYEICNSATSTCEAMKISLNVLPSASEEIKESLTALSTDIITSTYDLTLAKQEITGNLLTFYEDENLTKFIPTPENFATNANSVYVKISNSSTICFTVKKINLIPLPIIPDADLALPNFLSPNDDGYNDVLDFSILKVMIDVYVIISDRFGKKIFESNGKTFTWNGKNESGSTFPTNAYWAVFSWTSPKTNTKTVRKQWIMLKNH